MWNLEEIHLDIISVSRQGYAETALLPFALGCFRFRNGWRVLQLLDKTFAEQRSAISRIKLPCSYLALCYPSSLGTTEFPGLKSVGVWCIHHECIKYESIGHIIGGVRGLAGKPDLDVYFLDWKAPGS